MLSATRRLAALAFLVAGAACAAHSSVPDGARQDRNLITGEQIIGSHYVTPYDAVEALHPSWLRARGTDSFNNPSEVIVYVDNVKLGTVETLRSMDLRSIRYMRFYDASSANTRWGVGHAAGVIFVSTQQ